MVPSRRIFVQVALLLHVVFTMPSGAKPVGQDTTWVELDHFRTPPSPAFVLLGIEPNSVERPSTPQAVGASIVSAAKHGGALEIAPYWLAPRRRLTFDDYYNPGLGQAMLQTFTVSFATGARDENTDTLGKSVGVGFRTMLVQGSPTAKLKELRARLNAVQNDMLDEEDAKRFGDLNAEAKDIALALQAEGHKHVGLRLELAGAVTAMFAEDDVKKGNFDRWGIWLTGASGLEDQSFEFLGVLRMSGNAGGVARQTNIDLGGRVVYNSQDISLSTEYVRRSETSRTIQSEGPAGAVGTFLTKESFRLTGAIEYRQNKNISISMAFGQNFRTGDSANGGLVAQIGVHVGLGPIPSVGF
jgi:hypothetical protein